MLYLLLFRQTAEANLKFKIISCGRFMKSVVFFVLKQFWHDICMEYKKCFVDLGKIMQISDLKNSLLQFLTGRGEKKIESSQNSDFAELLQIGGQKAELVSDVSQAEVSAKAGETKSLPSVDVRKSNPVENRTNAPKADKNVANDKKEDSTPVVKEEKTSNQNTVQKKSDDTEASDADVTVNIVAQSSNQVVEAEVVAPMVAITEMLDSTEVSLEENTDIISEDDVYVENILPAEEENIIENKEVMPAKSLSDAAEVEADVLQKTENIVPVEVKSEEKNDDNLVTTDSVEKVAVKAKQAVNVAPTDDEVLSEDAVIREQEDKIAEILPPDAKVAIKVSVKDDAVTSFEATKRPLIQDVVEDKTVVAATDEQIASLDDNSEVNVVVNPVLEPIAAVVEPVMMPAENVTAVSAEAVKGDANIQLTAAGALPKELRTTATETVDNKSFKEILDRNVTKEVADQIKINITQSAIKGVDKIEIQLKPAALGNVEIKLQIAKDGRLQAHIVASNAETMEILQKDLSTLKDSFEAAGYQMDNDSFSFSYRGEQESSERERLREFIGEVISHDVAEETAANDYISADGVNIRV